MTVTATEAPAASSTAETVLCAHLHVTRAITDLLALAKADPTTQGAVLHTLHDLDREVLNASLQVSRDRNAAAAQS
jgi:hypothetical protein